jgi:Tfp pilus assembly protein PilE
MDFKNAIKQLFKRLEEPEGSVESLKDIPPTHSSSEKCVGDLEEANKPPEESKDTSGDLLKKIKELETALSKVNERINELEGLPKWVYWVCPISIVAIGLSIAAIYMDSGLIWEVESVSIAIVLAFVGILATFIVVSNYAQVEKIEREFGGKMQSAKSELESRAKEAEEEFNRKIGNATTNFDMKIKEQNEMLRDQLMYYSKAIGDKSKGDQYMEIGASINAFPHYINSLTNSVNAQDEQLISKNLDNCLNIIKKHTDSVLKEKNITNNIQIIMELLLDIQDKRSREIYAYFASFSKKEVNQSHLESQLSEENAE